jgi:hypothetical protein
VLQPLYTSWAASLLILGMFLFVVYGIWNHPKLCGDSKLLRYYENLDKRV